MHKYKYLLIFFSGILLLLLLLYFPISFDNNDDQTMYFINSGVFSGIPSANIIHTNLIIGLLLKKLFTHFNHYNWYTLFLQMVQLSSLLTIYFILIYNNKINVLLSCLLLFFLIFGFSALCIVKLQFTIVALLSCATALFCIQSNLSAKKKYLLALFFITVAILIRNDSYYIFIAFNTSILLNKFYKKEVDKLYLILLSLSIVLFFTFDFINNNNEVYKENETYKYCRVLDDAIDKPVKYTAADLVEFNFTEDDMIMMKARFPASASYNSGNNIIDFSKEIKSYRTIPELIREFKKFAIDERYMILIYLLSIISILLFAPKARCLMLLNGFVFFALLLYLAASVRIPHRVIFPMLIYVSIVNLFLFFKENRNQKISLIMAIIFTIIGSYKFYCTCKLIDLHTEYHSEFETCRKEINTHPDYLFISLHDGLPVEFMNAWQPPANLFPANNLIMTGWNVWAPDFQNTLNKHQLKNITSDLKNKQKTFFLTNSETYQKAFINVMKQRYNLTCHFEKIKDGFTYLKPKKLIFDN